MPRQKSLFRILLEPIAVAIGLALLLRAAVHLYSIPSASMAPTLRAGDQIVVTPYFGGTPQRGDVVVFASPARADELLVKRVIAVPGDLVDSRLGRVRIGGHTLTEPYLEDRTASGAIPAQIVPAGCYFVLGDNRGDSIDSRSWGFVQRPAIVGRARLVLWSSSGSGEVVHAADREAQPTRRENGGGRLFKWVR